MTIELLPLLVWLTGLIQTTHLPPWTAFHAEAPAFAAAVLGLFLQAKKAKAPMEQPALLGLLGLLAASVIVQQLTGLSLYGGDGHVVFAYLLLVLLAVWWGGAWASQVREPSDLVSTVSWFLVAAGLLTTFQLLAQWLDVVEQMGGWVYDRSRVGRLHANIGQPNQAATVLVMGVVAMQYLYAQRRISGGLAVACVALMAWAGVLTQSRTALVSTALITALLLWRPVGASFRCRAFALSWLGAVALMTLVFRAMPGPTVGAQEIVPMVTAGLRPVMWQQLIMGLMERPWTGWGWLQIPLGQQAGAEHLPGIEATDYSHNIVLDLVMMLGIPLTVLILAWAFKGVWHRRQSIVRSEAVWGMLCASMPVIVHAQLEYPHTYAYILLPVGLMLGAAERWTRPESLPQLRTMPRAWGMTIPLLIGVYYAGLAYDYVKVEEDYRFQRLTANRVGTTPSDYRAPDIWFLDQYDELLRSMNLPIVPGMSEPDLDMMLRVARRHTLPSVRYRAALALALNGRQEQAGECLTALKTMYPASVYENIRAYWQQLANERYPQLKSMALP